MPEIRGIPFLLSPSTAIEMTSEIEAHIDG
jgi:hypothetical protein